VIARYRTLFSVPGAGRLLAGSVLGRLPVGMFSLALLLFVHGRTGSFLAAGLAVGAFTAGSALVGPLLGIVVDRVGQAPVLLPAAAVQAAALLALVLAARVGAPVAVLVGLAALAGAALPPIAGCVRALWPQVAREEALETAYALDATTQEVIWTLGPLLVALAAGLGSPTAAVLLCAALTLCGTAWFAASSLSRGWRAAGGWRSRRSALAASPRLRLLLYTVVFAGIVIGAVEVGLTALAVRAGARGASGPLLALFSLGSMTGGLAYSARSFSLALSRRYVALLAAMALAVAPLIAAHSLAAAFPLSFLAGLALAPMISCQFSLVGALAPEGTVTEAFTWHRAATVAGMAGGTAVGGSLIDARGVGAAFALGCAGVAGAALLALVGRRRIEPRARPALAAADPAPVIVSAAADPVPAIAFAAADSVPAIVFAAADSASVIVSAADAPARFTLAAEAVALAAEAVALEARHGAGAAPAAAERPAAVTLAAEAVALAAQAVAQAGA
jgi:hypothetical protein